MNTKFKLTLAMLAGAAIGAAAVNGLHAQAKPPLYLVSEIDVTNPEAYGKEYAPKAQAKRTTVQVWDSMEQYQAYRSLPAFKEARQIGEKYAKFHTFAVEGVSQ